MAFDVAVHLGTLMAVMAYFRRELRQMSQGCRTSLQGGQWNADSRLAVAVVIGVLPAGLLGAISHSWVESHLRSSWIIAATTLLFGALLLFADKTGRRQLSTQDMSLHYAWLIGCAQALALVPGTSRSGITITMALLLGFTSNAAARFSFLLSIPLILAAASMKSWGLFRGGWDVSALHMLLGSSVAAITAYLTIGGFLHLLERVGMTPFVLYRMMLGVGLVMFLSVTG